MASEAAVRHDNSPSLEGRLDVRWLRTVDVGAIAWAVTLGFLFAGFFLVGFGASLVLLYTFAVLALALIACQSRTFVPFATIISCTGLIAAVGITVILSPYDASYGIKIALVAVDVVLLLNVVGMHEKAVYTRVFYGGASLVIVATFLLFVFAPQTLESLVGDEYVSASGLYPLFAGLPDKNETAVALFIYFCLALKKRWYGGIALSFCYPLLYFGRQYVVMVALLLLPLLLFKIQELMARSRGVRPHIFDRKYSCWVYFCGFLAMTILILALSYFWEQYVVVDGVGAYKTTLNDMSNAMRMLSNVYCFDLVLTPDFLLYGYGSDVFTGLGISGTDFSQASNVMINGRYRLVQPHEEVLNLWLRCGLLFVVFYYLTVSCCLSRLRIAPIDLGILLAFFTGSVILATLFKGGFLVGLVVALMARRPVEADGGVAKFGRIR